MHLPQNVAWYLICFAIGSALGLIPVWILEVLENTHDSPSATITAIGNHMEWVVVVSGAYSFVGVEGFSMLAEIFLKHREEKGREKGLEEGIVKGRVEGRVEERQQIASRFEYMTPDERMEEIERLIAEARREGRNGAK